MVFGFPGTTALSRTCRHMRRIWLKVLKSIRLKSEIVSPDDLTYISWRFPSIARLCIEMTTQDALPPAFIISELGRSLSCLTAIDIKSNVATAHAPTVLLAVTSNPSLCTRLMDLRLRDFSSGFNLTVANLVSLTALSAPTRLHVGRIMNVHIQDDAFWSQAQERILSAGIGKLQRLELWTRQALKQSVMAVFPGSFGHLTYLDIRTCADHSTRPNLAALSGLVNLRQLRTDHPLPESILDQHQLLSGLTQLSALFVEHVTNDGILVLPNSLTALETIRMHGGKADAVTLLQLPRLRSVSVDQLKAGTVAQILEQWRNGAELRGSLIASIELNRMSADEDSNLHILPKLPKLTRLRCVEPELELEPEGVEPVAAADMYGQVSRVLGMHASQLKGIELHLQQPIPKKSWERRQRSLHAHI
jgi:hypothetical protein